MQTTIVKNKKAFFDYEILESFEAGIVLKGYEVKSIRQGKTHLKGAYVSFVGTEAYLKGFSISPLASISPLIANGILPEYKLLLKKKDIFHLIQKSQDPGKTVIPVEVYLSGSLIKVRVCLAMGRKKYDKKQVLKERTMTKEAQKTLKQYQGSI